MTGGEKKNVCLFSQVQLLNIMLAMTLLASANNPRLQCYCAPEQSKQCRKAAFLLGTSAGTTRGWSVARVGACCPGKPGKSSHGRGYEGCLGISAYTGASARLPDVEVSAVGIPRCRFAALKPRGWGQCLPRLRLPRSPSQVAAFVTPPC